MTSNVSIKAAAVSTPSRLLTSRLAHPAMTSEEQRVTSVRSDTTNRDSVEGVRSARRIALEVRSRTDRLLTGW